MKLEGLIKKSLNQAMMVVLLIGVVLSVIAVFMSGKLVKVAAAFPVVVGITGAVLILINIGKLKSSFQGILTQLKENAQKLTGEKPIPPTELKDAPEEFKEVNQSFSAVVEKINQTLAELKKAEDLHRQDLEIFDKLYETFGESGTAEERAEIIIKRLKELTAFQNYYFFLKDPQANMLNRVNEASGEEGPLQNILLKDRKNKINDVFTIGEPLLIENIENDEKVKDSIRNWAKKNKVSHVMVVPVMAGKDPYGMVIYTVGDPQSLSMAQKLLVKLAMYILNAIFSEDKQIKELFNKFTGLEVENNIYTSLLEAGRYEDLCANFLTSFSKLVPMEWGGVAVFDKEQEAYVMLSSRIEDEITSLKKSLIPVVGSGINWVKENWKSWVEDDLTKTKPFQEDEIYAHENLKARVLTPLYSEKKFVGALCVASYKVGQYTSQYVREIEKVAKLLGPIIENTRQVTQMKKRLEELEKKNQNLERFYLNLAHEMKNPLNILTQIATVANKKSIGMTPKQVGDAFRFINKKTRVLTKSIEDILDFSRIQLGKIDFNPDEFFLIEVLKDVLWEFQDEAKEKMISLKWDIPKEMPEITGDRDRLRLVFKELIGNALEYTPQRGTISLKANLIPKSWLKEKAEEFYPPQILPQVDTEVDQVLISITNTGPGIPQDRLNDLFKAPTEVPEKMKKEGAGLGLGLPRVKQIIELHRGFIWVASQEGKGTRFSFDLPQYGRSWSILRTMLEDRINKAKQILASLTVITISLAEADELKQMLPPMRFDQLLKDLEKTVRSVIRDPKDIVWRLYDDETIVLISQVDIKKAASLQERIEENIKAMQTQALREPPEVEFTSLTYPDQVLSANELIRHLDKVIRKNQSEELDI